MRGKLMKLFTKHQHKDVLTTFASDDAAACEYTRLCGKAVSRQLVRYWRSIFIKNDGNASKTNRELSELRKFIMPSPDDDIGDLSFVPEKAQRILVIGDLHAPYHHKDALEFLAHAKATIRPDLVIQMGDELDFHALSFHDSDPNLDSAGVELEKGKAFLRELHELFPDMLICHSNHGSMVYRRAGAHGLPVQVIKKYRDILFPESGAPGWSWAFGWRIHTPHGQVLFKHQASEALASAAHEGCNVVLGHVHGKFGVTYAASSSRLYYGAQAGCLLDKDALAFAYGKNCNSKPIIGCLVIVNGIPTAMPMHLDHDGRWSDRKDK